MARVLTYTYDVAGHLSSAASAPGHTIHAYDDVMDQSRVFEHSKFEERADYAGDDPVNGGDPLGLSPWGWVASQATQEWNATGGQLVSGVEGVIQHGRLPDYVNLNLSAVIPVIGPVGPGIGFNVTVTRNGALYYGPEGGVGIVGASESLEAGWINQYSTPTACQLNQFVGGWGLTANAFVPILGVPGIAGLGLAGGETWGNEGGNHANDFGTNIGVGIGATHYVGGMQGYNFRAPFNLPGW